MNGQLFAALNLGTANFEGNECIDINFSHADLQPISIVSNEFLLEVSKKCKFPEFTESNEISCLENKFCGGNSTVCCSFNNSSIINSTNFYISDRRHDGVNYISFSPNSKVEFLPISVFLKFSNVRTYNADHCSIQEVSKLNFEHLLKLQVLSLTYNRIKSIKHDTFTGLASLKKIMLSKVERLLQITYLIHLFTRQQPNCGNEWPSF